MKRLIILVSLLVAFLLPFKSYSKEVNYAGVINSFSLHVPSDWEIEHTEGEGQGVTPVFYATSPQTNENDEFAENLTAGVVSFSYQITQDVLKKESKISDKGMKSMVKAYKVHSFTTSLIDRLPALWKVISFSLPNNVSVKSMIVWVGVDKEIYSLVFASTPSEYKRYERTFEEIAKSFKLAR